MSKSKGNVVTQDDMVKKYGVDAVRVFLLGLAHPAKTVEWDDNGIEAAAKFINRVYGLKDKAKSENKRFDKHLISRTNKFTKEVEENIEDFNFNIALIKIQEFANYLSRVKRDVSSEIFEDGFKKFLIVFSCFAPHVCEELYEYHNEGYVSLASWPKYDKNKINERLEKEDDFVSGLIGDLHAILKLVKVESPKKLKIYVADEWKYEVFRKFKELNSRNKSEIMQNLMVKGHEKEIVRLVPMLLKKGVDEIILDRKTEIKVLIENKRDLEKEFKLEVEIIEKDNGKALPFKPGILVE